METHIAILEEITSKMTNICLYSFLMQATGLSTVNYSLNKLR